MTRRTHSPWKWHIYLGLPFLLGQASYSTTATTRWHCVKYPFLGVDYFSPLFAYLALAHLTPLPLLFLMLLQTLLIWPLFLCPFPPFVPYPCLTASRLKIRRLRQKRIAQTLVDLKCFFPVPSLLTRMFVLALKKHYWLLLCRGNFCFSLKGRRMFSFLHWQWRTYSDLAVYLDKWQEEFTHLIIRETWSP